MAECDSRRRPTGRCRHCGRLTFNGSDACKARRCPGYGPLWAGDQRRKLFDNLVAFGELVRVKDALVVMFTVTAPGADCLPWDRAICAGLGPHSCSGDLGCSTESRAAKAWNRTAPRRWRALHRRAHIDTSRIYGSDDGLWMLCRVWEKQARGVLHVHPVFACATPRQKAAAEHYLSRLEEWAAAYGFGFVSRKFRPQPARGAAAYLSAYFCHGNKNKMTLRESVTTPNMPRSIVHVSTRLTQATGITMRELRFRRFVWARYPGLMGSGLPGAIASARSCAQLERVLHRTLTPVEFRCIWICERAAHDP